jgi:hypothetical protein
MTEEQQKKTLELKHMTNGVTGEESIAKEANGTGGAACSPAPAGGCCQGNGGGFTCCQSDLPEEKQDKSVPAEENHKSSTTETDKESGAAGKKGHMKICQMPNWFETWERKDTYATLAVVTAAATVFVAFRIYKNTN